MTILLISILQVTNNHIASKSIFINKKSITGVGDGKMIVEADVIGKESKTGFVIPEARLACANLREALTTTPISYYLDSKRHILIKTDP